MSISAVTMRPYQWRGKDGGWQVGRPLLIDGEFEMKGVCVRGKYAGEAIAMQPSHASPPTWVPVEDMQPYPAEPIEEPAVKGGE